MQVQSYYLNLPYTNSVVLCDRRVPDAPHFSIAEVHGGWCQTFDILCGEAKATLAQLNYRARWRLCHHPGEMLDGLRALPRLGNQDLVALRGENARRKGGTYSTFARL